MMLSLEGQIKEEGSRRMDFYHIELCVQEDIGSVD